MLLTLEQIRQQVDPQANVTGVLGLDEYQKVALRTDKTGKNEGGASIVLLGLFGEVGGLLAELKKKQKDQNTFRSYARSAMEEMGDVLWYLAVTAHKAGVKFSEVAEGSSFADLQPNRFTFNQPVAGPHAESRLVKLAACTGRVAERWSSSGLPMGDEAVRQELADVFKALIAAADDAEVSLEKAAVLNLQKILDRHPVVEEWGEPFDLDFDEDERLPDLMQVVFKEKKTARGDPYVIQKWNGVNVGDRLTDNSSSEDYYRYHDVFHLSYAAFLGWSPVLRSLLRLKRKSNAQVDELQDGARAVITEEGISNWIFSHGMRHDAFADEAISLEFALLQTVRDMVKGYEVEDRPLWIWERAILEGFKMFRLLRDNHGGVITADMRSHTLAYSKDP